MPMPRVPTLVEAASRLEFPVLGGAGFAEFVEGAGADQRFHFFVEWLDASDEILERRERAVGAFVQNRFFGLESEAFDVGEGDANTNA